MDPQSVQPPRPILYICGGCGSENGIKTGEPIRCLKCSYPVLYKKRTRRIIMHLAR
ncbi:DNA-directed RNA polymerase [Zostera marina]|uniref:DNA-directed RNA polymerase n=1 Tax=Zostera marina TaxID=29655 RepID=A0A0K9PIP9_ZOSMR|nr:DNA-directed RNA polymerase [Zostera marina]